MGYSNLKKRAYVNGMIIILNVAYFIYLEINGSTSHDTTFMVQSGAMYAPYVVENKEYYRLFTSIFMHFGFSHLLNNMVILFVLGDNMERALGKVRYLAFYITCGVGANIVSMFFNVNEYRQVVSAGASGAIFGIVGGLVYAVAVNRGKLEDLSSRQLTLLVIFSLYAGFKSSGTDNVAHVAGLILGVILAIIFYHKPQKALRD